MSQGRVIDIMTFNSYMSQGRVIDIMTFISYSLQYYSFWKGKMDFGFLMWWQVRCCGGLSWRNRAWIRKIWAKRWEFKKKVLSLPTILKINNGLNGYAPEYVGNHDAAEDAAVICTLWAAASWHRSTYANGRTTSSPMSTTTTTTTHSTWWSSCHTGSSSRASSEILKKSSKNPGLIPRILKNPARFWKSP